jgi:hypothetical protein
VADRARLAAGVQRGAGQAERAQVAARGTDRGDLGVRGRVVVAQRGVHPGGDDVVAAGDDRSERQLADGDVAEGQVDGLAKEQGVAVLSGHATDGTDLTPGRGGRRPAGGSP